MPSRKQTNATSVVQQNSKSKRVFHSYGLGRADVFPFKLKDFKEMLRICQVRMEHANPESHEYMRWYRNYVMLILGCNTGCRIETLLQLTPKHIAGGYITVVEYKTKKKKQYPLNNQVYQIVEDYILWLNQHCKEYMTEYTYIFHTYRNTQAPLTRQQASKVIKELAKEVGIKYNVGCHSLRKSYGRFEYDQSHDIFKVQKMLDHSSSVITEKYICLEPENIEKSRRKNAWGLD